MPKRDETTIKRTYLSFLPDEIERIMRDHVIHYYFPKGQVSLDVEFPNSEGPPICQVTITQEEHQP